MLKRSVHIFVLLLFVASHSPAKPEYQLALRAPHVWRGITLREFPIFSFAATISRPSGFQLELWMGFDLADDNGRGGELQEIDVDLSYQFDLLGSRWSVGYVELFFPGGIDPTGEAYLKWQGGGPWSPRLEAYYNVDLLEDFYVQGSLSHSFPEAHLIRPALTAVVAYSGEDFARFFGGEGSGWHHWALHLDLGLDLAGQDLRLRFSYSESLQETTLPAQPSRFWSGLYLTLPGS